MLFFSIYLFQTYTPHDSSSFMGIFLCQVYGAEGKPDQADVMDFLLHFLATCRPLLPRLTVQEL